MAAEKEGKRVLPKARPAIPEGDIAAILADLEEVLRSGQLTMGPFLARFESEFAALAGTDCAVAMHSGTAPLEVAMRYWNVEGGEVVVPTNTFAASANAVLLAGGYPVLADMDASTLCSGLEQIEPLVGPRTRGIVAVHLAGLIAPDIEAQREFCRARGLFLLEDAAHAHGASLVGKPAGCWGDAAAFSLFPTKVITCGEGGVLTTNDGALAAYARSFRCHGIAAEGRSLERLGSNYRLPEMSAALALSQVRRLREFVAERNVLARSYLHSLATIKGLGLFPPSAEHLHAWYKFPVRLPAGSPREEVLARLARDWGVQGGGIYWPPCHLEPFYRARGYGEGDLPVAEEVLSQVISLPLYIGMQERDIIYVSKALANVLAEGGTA